MPLPTFLLCGAQKAGTTALYEALRTHPDVCMSRPKETEFFNWRYRRGWEWFATHFDHHDGEAAIGEASTRTMPTPEAPERIAERLSEVKLIFVLRDPAERAHSAFWYYVEQGILCQGADFSAFIRNEGHPLRQEIMLYGDYYQHLDRFLQVFDHSQFLLIRHRDLLEEMRTELKRTLRFVGGDPADLGSKSVSTRSNTTRYPRSQLLHGLARRVWKPMDRLVSHWAPGVAKKIRHVGKQWSLGADRPSLTSADRSYLWRRYESMTHELERRFDLDLRHWGPQQETVRSRA
ncbi:sulfotransferase domain-containing protein [Salinibacter ruber]|uniref:Sulfotransferase domain-containing protein n=1 Tax=Salinibacter ruber TaxID=146919 RepID=A0A9X2Q9G0_9BACT|nr:sulfotransferase domain-containing protein [Salinibacter ruber]MCS3662054.1 hypothetical protein [Salinibacter ruber]MCS3711891.1 hypothetical protein [Salinibacter ruber]